MAPVRRVAVVQWRIKSLLERTTKNQDLAIQENHARACDFIRDAASKGAELVVLPEYHLNGFAPEDPEYIRQTEPEVYQGYLRAYQNLARELAICLVPGTIVERHVSSSDQSESDKSPDGSDSDSDKSTGTRAGAGAGEIKVLYNTTYFISPQGTILSSYRKKNIWHPERPYLTSSGVTDEPHVGFDTPIGKVGLLICWDVAFPEAFRELVRGGVEIIIVPTFWTKHDATPAVRSFNPNSERLFLESTLTTRAFENTCGLVFVNAAGGSDEPEDKYLGLSRVSLPVVGTVGSMENEEGVLVVDMDLGLLDVAEKCYGVRGDLSSSWWHYGYKRA